jgi:hypothetical protein
MTFLPGTAIKGRCFPGLLLIMLIMACERGSDVAPERVDFNLHIKPVLSDRCFKCHGPDANKRKADLALHVRDGFFTPPGGKEGRAPVVPFKPERSELYRRISSGDPEYRMPPPESHLQLSDDEIRLIERWIEEGAGWKPHWAFIPPQKPALPEIQSDWPANPIVRFVLRQLQKKGLRPSPAADRETLIRRVTFDLTGLPPGLEEIGQFLSDSSAGAYETLVDRLLASPAYGERMATEWLDVARYADTYGYQADNYRPMWYWRDWVISAFNRNLLFDAFITWQIAGDLLPGATRVQILATGFNRNHQQNAEGGIVNEEFRVEYAADRTNTLGKALLGITLECARCHDHKYDPISQKEYYQLFSFFNNVDEAGQITWSMFDIPSPTLLLTTPEDGKILQQLDEEISQKTESISRLRESEQAHFHQWLAGTEVKADAQPRGLIAHFPLDDFTDLKNRLNPEQSGEIADAVTLKRASADPEVVNGKVNKALKLNGDDLLNFPEVGEFLRANPFSIALWVYIPGDLKKGVVFHSNRGGIIYAFKGYQLSVEGDRFDIRLAHTFPYNSIHLESSQPVPRDKWVHLLLTYDGSSKASGVTLYKYGEKQPLRILRDNLYKEIAFVHEEERGIKNNLRVGGRWRSKGLTGGMVDELLVFDRELTALEASQIAGNPLQEMPGKRPDNLNPEERQLLFDYYLANHSDRYQQLLKELGQLRLRRNACVEEIEEAMVMAEMPVPREAYVLKRGVYDEYGEPVSPGAPEHILPFPQDLPENRLGLARWLIHPQNPLTARVVVNRYWQQYFGRGLVLTSEDFGNQGDLPSHPELLDWLAVHFMESGWDVKAMQKTIVMSATYRQSSRADSALLEMDPENILLARGPKKRLSAEMLRDQALAASGLLVRKIGGPSVKPYQPDGLWSFGQGHNKYEPDKGDNLYRRSLYTFWKRTVPPPTMNMFDAPERSYCVVRREQTTTPLQMLALMNDPQFLEASRVLAEKALLSERHSDVERITRMFRQLTSRQPTAQELDLLVRLLADQKDIFRDGAEKANGLLQQGEYALNPSLRKDELAAYTVIASTIMNFDASVVLR